MNARGYPCAKGCNSSASQRLSGEQVRLCSGHPKVHFGTIVEGSWGDARWVLRAPSLFPLLLPLSLLPLPLLLLPLQLMLRPLPPTPQSPHCNRLLLSVSNRVVKGHARDSKDTSRKKKTKPNNNNNNKKKNSLHFILKGLVKDFTSSVCIYVTSVIAHKTTIKTL